LPKVVATSVGAAAIGAELWTGFNSGNWGETETSKAK